MIDIRKIINAIARSFADGSFDWSFLKGEKGDQGTSAIWNAEAEQLTELEHTTGQATNRTMSQKAITDNIGITMTQAEYDAITQESNVKYIIAENLNQ